MRVLGTLSSSQDNRALSDQYLHLLVTYLISMGEDFSNEEFCTVVFDEIFLTSLSIGNVVHHLMKLLFHVHQHLSSSRIQLLTDTLQSYSYHNEASQALFNELKEKIEQSQAAAISFSSTQSNEEPDFPLVVPTPAPHRSD